MDSEEEDFNRFRYRTRVQAVAVIDILVGTIPFIKLAFAFNDKHLADLYQDREYLVLLWSVLLCVYVLQLIMGIWLLAATREVYSEYTVGNCQVWFYVALFSFVFYTGEMAFAISSIISGPSSQKSIKQVFMTMSYHALKIIYRAFTLMVVNNFLYDVCRPVYRYLSQGSFQYKYYYHSRLGIPLPLPPRRRISAAPAVVAASAAAQQQSSSGAGASTNNYNAAFPNNYQLSAPTYRYYSTYPQPRNKLLLPPPIPPDNSSRLLSSSTNLPQEQQPQPQPPQYPYDRRIVNHHLQYHSYPYPYSNNMNNTLRPSATTRTFFSNSNPSMSMITQQRLRQRQLSNYYYETYTNGFPRVNNSYYGSYNERRPPPRPPRADPTGATHVPPEAFLISIG